MTLYSKHLFAFSPNLTMPFLKRAFRLLPILTLGLITNLVLGDFSCIPRCHCPQECCPQLPAYGLEVPCNFASLYSAGPKICCAHAGNNTFITASYLWWTAREEGLAFAGNGVNINLFDDAGAGNVYHPDWQWASGFKIALGLNLRHDDWDIVGRYTWIDFHGHKTSANDHYPLVGNNELLPYWINYRDNLLHNFANQTLEKAHGNWQLLFQTFDCELGKSYFATQMVIVRPFTGIKVAWQRAKYRVGYHFNQDGYQPLTLVKMRQYQNLWGVGIRSGLDLNFLFSRNWSLNSSLAFTPLLSHYGVDRLDLGSTGEQTAFLTLFDAHNDFYKLSGIFEAFLGLQFDTWIDKSHRYHMQGKLGWDEQIWINHNQLIKRQEISSHGDLSLHGLQVEIRVDF